MDDGHVNQMLNEVARKTVHAAENQERTL